MIFCVFCLATDIDECEEVSNMCTKGQCINTPGSFHCECSQGYELSPTADDCSGQLLCVALQSSFRSFICFHWSITLHGAVSFQTSTNARAFQTYVATAVV